MAKATEFLVALPARNDSSTEKKCQFLRSKGLTDQEIQESFQRASTICNKNPNFHNNAIVSLNYFEVHQLFKLIYFV